jgi:hypothetical protein
MGSKHYFLEYATDFVIHDMDKKCLTTIDSIPNQYLSKMRVEKEQYDKKEAMKQRLRAKLEAKKQK